MKTNTKLFQEETPQLMTDDKRPSENAVIQEAAPGEQPSEKKIYFCDLTGMPIYAEEY